MSFERKPEVSVQAESAQEEKEMMEEVALRSVQPDDFARLKEHWIRMATAHPEEYSLTPEAIAKLSELSFQYLLQDPLQIRFLSVDAKGDVLGTIGLEIDEHTLNAQAERRGEVKAVAVHPERQGEKIGEKMLGQLIEYTKQAGFSELTIFVRKENTAAKHLYAKYGFIATGKITDEEGDPNQVMEEYLLNI